jgi:hypothetical protein
MAPSGIEGDVMDAAGDSENTVQSGDDVSYAYKPSLMGVPFEFRLAPDALEWRKGKFTGSASYDQIRRIRLSFRPMTMQHHRFMAEIWPADATKMQIASTSMKSMFEQERLDQPYRTFIVELSRRIGAAGGQTVFDTGSPAFLFWPGLVVFLSACLALSGLIVRALQTEAWSGAAFVAAFLALFIWQGGGFFRRNRPGPFRPDAVPETVLPRG